MRAKLIRGFGGFYKVREDGTVWSCHVKGSNGKAKGPWWKMKPRPHKFGYVQYHLRKNGRYHYLLAHRLVLEAFVGPCPKGMEARHYPDRNPANNHRSNLSWADHGTNMRDKALHGTHAKGERHHGAVLTEDDVIRLRAMYATGAFTQKDLSRIFRTSQPNVSDVVRKKIWSHV